MKRERIDKTMSRVVVKRVIRPFVEDLGAQHLVGSPYLGAYDHENKSITWGLGHKRHGDKRHRTSVKFEGIYYKDGQQIEGKTNTVEIDHRVGWSRKIDNRLSGESRHRRREDQQLRGNVQQAPHLQQPRHHEPIQRNGSGGSARDWRIGQPVPPAVQAHTEVETEKFNPDQA